MSLCLIQKAYKPVLIAGLVALTAVGCARKPTPEEMDALNQQIKAADDAEARVAELESQKQSLESELSQLQTKYTETEAEFETLKQRLPEGN